MSDLLRDEHDARKEIILAWKDLLWVVFAWAFVFVLLAASLTAAFEIYTPAMPADQAVKLFVAAIGVPAFVVVAIYAKISSEMIAVILAAIIGFALGVHVIP